MTMPESSREEVTFQSLSTVHRTESSFCFPSDSKLNVISAVSLPLSGDDGAWQYGGPRGLMLNVGMFLHNSGASVCSEYEVTAAAH